MTGGEEIAEEISGGDADGGGGTGDEDGAGDGRRAFGVTSVHACDDGSRIAVRERMLESSLDVLGTNPVLRDGVAGSLCL